MTVGKVGHSGSGFQSKFSLLESVGVDRDDPSVKAIFPIDNRRERHQNSVITTCGIVVKVKECSSGEVGQVVFQFFE